jgi:GGDEF domain-containing protein
MPISDLRFSAVSHWARRCPVALGIALGVSVPVMMGIAARGYQELTGLLVVVVVAYGVIVASLPWSMVASVVIWVGWLAAMMVNGASVWHQLPAVVVSSVTSAALGRYHRGLINRADDKERRARAAAMTDERTGLASRRGVLALGQYTMETARRQGDAVHCAFVGTGFERAGLTLAVADALMAVTRGSDVVGLWSPDDEFCVVGPGQGSPAAILERRLMGRLEAAGVTAAVEVGKELPRGISIGCAVLAPWDGGDLSELINGARREMLLRRDLHADGGQSVS